MSTLGKIGQILIPVADTERSVPFYRDVLGLPYLFSAPHMAFFDAAGTRVLLNDAEPAEFQGHVTLYLSVDDIDSVVAELTARGAAFEDAPHIVHRSDRVEVWLAFMRDPDGHHIALMDERPRSPGE